MKTARLNQSSKGASRKAKTMREKMLKHPIELRGTAMLGNNSLLVRHYKQPLSHYTLSETMLCNIKILMSPALNFAI